ncbi:MAG TPA: class I SAM-dependent methyltransferase [Longimicrobiales bacterium]
MSILSALPSEPLPAKWRDGADYPEVDQVIREITSSWSVSPEAARAVAHMVVTERRTGVLEFGAGGSSRVFAAALERIGGGRLTSLEEAPQWSAQAWRHVEASPHVDAKLIPASVRLTADRGGVYFGYRQLEEVLARGPYDFVFIDAPAGPYGRDGALRAAFEALAPGALIVLDDARRAREQRTVRRWLLAYPELRLVANDPSIGRGLAVLEKMSEPQHRIAGVGASSTIWLTALYDMLRSPRGIHRHRRRKKRAERASRK